MLKLAILEVVMSMPDFDGKCMIGFIYKRGINGWELISAPMDQRIMALIWPHYENPLSVELPMMRPDQRPAFHKKILLQALVMAELDGGSAYETFGPDEITLEIEIKKRQKRYRPL